MAKTKDEKKSQYEYPYKRDYQEDWDHHRDYVQSFDAYESMLLGQVYDSVSRSIDASKITDSYTATLAKERADRVMAKLPEGETVAVSKGDVGKAMFMDVLRQKWIYPNANAQHPFPVKLNLWQLYSDVYGYMPMFYDWNVTNTGYAGPDCWLLNPRNVIPQQGRTSVEDMEHLHVDTSVSKSYFEDLLEDSLGEDKLESLKDGKPTKQDEDDEEDNDGWNLDAVQELLNIIENKVTDTDPEKTTLAERTRTPNGKRKGIRLATRYEAGDDGEWITFAPDHSFVEVRRIKNPHKNGRIPIVVKYSQALYDSFYGLGRFQRAKPIQFARDGLTNFYFKGIKMNLIPPLVVNANGVLKHTIDYREGAVMMETAPNSIRRLETSTAGLSTYQGAQSNMTGSLLSLFGSQNASLPGADSLNPSQGKTPQAISLYGDKEATQDGADLRNLQVAIEQLTDGFFSLVSNINTEDIPITLYAKDIEEIAESGMGDISELFNNFKLDENGLTGELKIKSKALRDVELRFNVAPGSTVAKNKADNLGEWERMVANISKLVNVIKDDPNVTINWGKIMETGESLSNIRGAKDFITVKEGPTQAEQEMQAQMEQMQQMVQELQQQLQTEQMKAEVSKAAPQPQAQPTQQPQQQAPAPVEQPPQPPEPIEVGGELFSDPDIAAAAQSIM
jgi:hypothetical protein